MNFIPLICQFHLWQKCQRIYHRTALRQSMQEMLGDLIVFSDCLILITMDRGHCQAVLKHKVPNPTHRRIKNCKMYAIKQIKIYAKYWYIAPKASADLSGTQIYKYRLQNCQSPKKFFATGDVLEAIHHISLLSAKWHINNFYPPILNDLPYLSSQNRKSNFWCIDYHEYETYYCFNHVIFVGESWFLFTL